MRKVVTAAVVVFLAHSVCAQFVQEGPKLVGTGAVGGVLGGAWEGWAVALSGDGNTAIVGGPMDDMATGAAWVFTRSGGSWAQQGTKLVGTGASGSAHAHQGWSVALSYDGNTAVVGGSQDNAGAPGGLLGATWVFTRSGGVWTQQGNKLVGTGAVGDPFQAWSVAISGDGGTILVGGPLDAANDGAAWVFTRSGGVWTQQGTKLVGTGAVGGALQGRAVALSFDGNTAIIGGPWDAAEAGAAWAFIRSGGVWTQQGGKLLGNDVAGPFSHFGDSVALSADGNTALVGGSLDLTSPIGAAWVFTRSGGVWTQQGSKLVGTGADGVALQGTSVALSGDGNTALISGPGDARFLGAGWAFVRSGGVWSQLGTKMVGTGAVGTARQGQSVALSADGSTAIVGGNGDAGRTGAAWVYRALPVQPTTLVPMLGKPGLVALGASLLALGALIASHARLAARRVTSAAPQVARDEMSSRRRAPTIRATRG